MARNPRDNKTNSSLRNSDTRALCCLARATGVPGLRRQQQQVEQFGGTRGARPVPPEKGIFPLDHLHECDLEKKEYIACLKSLGHQSEKMQAFIREVVGMSYAKKLDG
ncbi:hypothetical protein Cni_G00175 [Canna indica]|uniref:Uncharacterized protein n=1 Tax=Canna indica TaxID=4628 RepID=A0AAQ3JMC1_9LILI|nr:hypothetical protein Cni_G00175 [Canna indica]